MSVTLLQVAPFLGGAGGIGTALGVYLTRRGAVAERRVREALVQDEILGHKGVQGVPDKRGISERLGAIELIGNQNARELHPNGGHSLADNVVETRRLAELAVTAAADVAEKAAELKTKVEAHALLDQEHWRIITDHFIELPKEGKT